jgi:aspartate kinase
VRIAIAKIGGSLLTGLAAYRRVAEVVDVWVRDDPDRRLVVVVSAELGLTDTLLATARDLSPDPDPIALDILWSTGELRSVALLTLALRARGVDACAVNAHQTGLVESGERSIASPARLHPLRLRAQLTVNRVVIVPGFLACGDGHRLVSLGRGGSDLTAVLVAAGLGAERCELVKDVGAYFTADPHSNPHATPLARVSFDHALSKAREGCPLVQADALETARALGVSLVVRGLEQDGGTVIG